MDEWRDRLAIHHLIYRYSDAVTRGDWAQCAAAFAPNALWECPLFGMRYESIDEFVQTLRATKFEVLIQTPQSPVVTFTDADSATATTTIHEMNRSVMAMDSTLGAAGEPVNIEMYGIYYDDIARIDGEWKFTHRLFVPFYVTPGTVTGDVVTPRSQLCRP